jgi:hypothetical protein
LNRWFTVAKCFVQQIASKKIVYRSLVMRRLRAFTTCTLLLFLSVPVAKEQSSSELSLINCNVCRRKLRSTGSTHVSQTAGGLKHRASWRAEF